MQENQLWRVSAAAMLLAAVVFVADLQIPLGVAGGVPYVAVILLGWWFPRRRHIFYLAAISSVLTATGYLLSPDGGIPWMVAANRFLALFAIWVTAALLNAAKAATELLSQAHDELETRVERRTRQLDEQVREHELTEQALRESEQRLFEAQRLAKLGNWSRDIETGNFWWSEEVYKIFGLEPQESGPDYETFLKKIHSDDRQKVAETVDRAISGRKPFDIDHRIVLPDGMEKTVHVSGEVICGEAGEPIQLIGAVQDITDRIESETMARRLNEAIDVFSGCVALYDAEDCLVFCNAPFRELNSAVLDSLVPGSSFEEHLKALLAKHLVPNAIGHEGEWLAKRLESHRNPEGPLEILRQDDQWFLAYEKRLGDGGYVLLLTDISDMKRAESERGEALEQAEKASQAKSAFLATMSHELRTPLNAILGFSEIISLQYFGPLGDPKYQEYANDIRTSGYHLLELINDVLDLSAIEAGKISLTRENIEIGDIVEECSRTIADAAEQKGVSYRAIVPASLAPVYADRRAIKQVLLNLLSNAFKFTPEGGKIRLNVSAANGHCTIDVADTGEGVPADKLARLTDPFVRVEPDPHKTQEGTGLGLSIVDSLVRLHGGELEIKSKLGKGTTVTVKLPIRGR